MTEPLNKSASKDVQTLGGTNRLQAKSRTVLTDGLRHLSFLLILATFRCREKTETRQSRQLCEVKRMHGC